MAIHFARWRNFPVVPLAIATIVCGGWYQAAAPAGPEVPPPTIRVSSHMVLVDVVVTDKQGQSVADLKPEDFIIQENGKAQKISVFVTPGQNKPAATAPALPPGVYSNRPQFRSPGGPITVLLLDAANTAFKDQAYARLQMLRFVREQYKPGERMAVFTLTDSLRELQDFTTDPQILYTALQRYVPQERPFASAAQPTQTDSGTPTAANTVAALDASTLAVSDSSSGVASGLRAGGAAQVSFLQAALQGFTDAQVAYNLDRRTEITLTALDALARILGGLPGRKSVIWVTGDLPFTLIPEDRTVTDAELAEDLPSLDTRRVGEHAAGNYAATARGSFVEQIRDAASRLSAAQVALYPVDARGLSISLDHDAQDVMREMASETGGRAYVNQNEIRDGVARALEDDSAAYTLGYYPENKKWDGKYRTIKVKIDRDNITAQHRRGYFALDPTQTKGFNPSQEVSSALNVAIPATLVAFSARLVPPAANSVKGKLGVDFLVDASTLSAEDVSGGKKMNVLFYVTTFSSNGAMVGNQSQKVDQTFNSETYQKIMQHGMLLHLDVEPKTNGAQLRLAVQDGQSGLVGTIDAPLNAQN